MSARLVFLSLLCSLALAGRRTLFAEEFGLPPSTRPAPITREEVWQSVVTKLREQGRPEGELPTVEDLDIPVALPAPAGRQLRVASACWDTDRQRAQFRLACRTRGACLHFLVYVRASVRGDFDASCERLNTRTLRPEVVKPVVRSGDRATAIFAVGALRMTARVTCLERGRVGEVIRVRNQAGQTFRARVSSPALLEVLPQS
jgi:hypothetical protein